MGSRLKGRKSPKKKDSSNTFKLVVYAVVILGAVGSLWCLWFSEEGSEVSKRMQQAGESQP